jgi:uncharacterized membrane protein (DUF4010 family)
MTPELDAALRIGTAAVAGAVVGLERQRSGHATGPRARFAGIRTFTLLGGLGGFAGWLWTAGASLPGAVVLAGGAALVVAAYAAASRREIDGTTEAAALVVLAAGCAAGLGHLALASGTAAITALLLVEKTSLHALVARVDDVGLRAGARFAVMAVVVLPLLRPGPYGPLGGIRPRALWALVLLFSGLGFAGYVARRLSDPRRGTAVAGLLGGLVSSTGVTFAFARASRTDVAAGGALAAGVTAASALMFARVAVVTGALAPALARETLPFLVPPLAVGGALAWWRNRAAHAAEAIPPDGPPNPLQIWPAIQMAALFQAVLFAVRLAHDAFGDLGLVASGAVIGLADMDALVFGLARAAQPLSVQSGATALACGALSNTLLKLLIAASTGSAPFRRAAVTDLGVIAGVAGLALLVW